MNDAERNELVKLCHRYAANMKLPEPLPTTLEAYKTWSVEAAKLPQDKDADDAWLEVYSLIHDEPDEAWLIIRELLRQIKDEGEAGAVGAGILQSFVRHHGNGWVEEIEQEMSSNFLFVSAMENVRGIERHPELDERISRFLSR